MIRIVLAMGMLTAAAWSQTPQEQSQFLKAAKVLTSKTARKGITGTQRVTLSDGRTTHEAQFQSIDVSQLVYQTTRGPELNFRDSYRFNIAAYRLAVLLGLGDRVPVSVERRMLGRVGAATWWIDRVQFDEGERLKRKAKPPDQEAWNRQMYVVRVFDQLIYNTDRNLGNLLVDEDWKIWMIDHTRAFRMFPTLVEPRNLVRCEAGLLERLRTLERAEVATAMDGMLSKAEIDALLARRDLIVRFFDGEVARRGQAAVLFEAQKS